MLIDGMPERSRAARCGLFDKGSSYPWSIFRKMPMGRWSYIREPSILYIESLINKSQAVLMRVRLFNINLHDRLWGFPYIPYAKSRNCVRPILDNGRILRADMLEITITDIDYRIMAAEYDFDLEIIEAWTCRYGYLPRSLRNLVIAYYNSKTELKGVPDQAYTYSQRKALLNSIYGCCVQDVMKDLVKWNPDACDEYRLHMTFGDYEKKKKSMFLSYAWGVWITSWSRWDLERALRYVYDHGGEPLYIDTDSVKYISDIDMAAFNLDLIRESKKKKTYAADINGKIHYLGEWEFDGKYKSFKTLGAKKYCYIDFDDKLHLTLAGVSPGEGARELESLEEFKEGKVFSSAAAGLEAHYVDHVNWSCKKINEHNVEMTSYVRLDPGEYTLGLAGDYKRLLEYPEYYLAGFDEEE